MFRYHFSMELWNLLATPCLLKKWRLLWKQVPLFLLWFIISPFTCIRGLMVNSFVGIVLLVTLDYHQGLVHVSDLFYSIPFMIKWWTHLLINVPSAIAKHPKRNNLRVHLYHWNLHIPDQMISVICYHLIHYQCWGNMGKRLLSCSSIMQVT